jgi:hypothetical protein
MVLKELVLNGQQKLPTHKIITNNHRMLKGKGKRKGLIAKRNNASDKNIRKKQRKLCRNPKKKHHFDRVSRLLRWFQWF